MEVRLRHEFVVRLTAAKNTKGRSLLAPAFRRTFHATTAPISPVDNDDLGVTSQVTKVLHQHEGSVSLPARSLVAIEPGRKLNLIAFRVLTALIYTGGSKAANDGVRLCQSVACSKA